MDHWFQMENIGGPAEPMLEAYLTLAHVAAVTETHPAQRPGDRARRTAIPGCWPRPSRPSTGCRAGGRCSGIGAGWYEREHLGLGVPFPSTAERFERLEETLQICLQMWSDDDGPYDGAHFQLAETGLRAAAAGAAAPADPDRGSGGEEDAADGRPVRAVVQHLRRVAGA